MISIPILDKRTGKVATALAEAVAVGVDTK